MSTAVPPQRERLTGVCPAAQGCVVSGLVRLHPAPVWLVVTGELKAAEALAEIGRAHV